MIEKEPLRVVEVGHFVATAVASSRIDQVLPLETGQLQFCAKRGSELLQTFANLRAGPGGKTESEGRIFLCFHKTG